LLLPPGDGRRLFGLFWPLTIAQSHTGAAAVLVDEIYSGLLYSVSYFDPEFFGYRWPAQEPRPKSTKCYKIELSGRAALSLHPLHSILLGPAHLNGVIF
jgi:hypothetical protein